jgi:predicted DNA-binding protein
VGVNGRAPWVRAGLVGLCDGRARLQRSRPLPLSYVCDNLYDMSTKIVTRSVRLEADANQQLERLAAERGMTVSAFIRETLADVTERAERRRRLERALELAAQLPELDDDRNEMWGIGTRVSG